MNTNIHPFFGPEKGVEKSGLHSSTKTARHCVDVFHRNFSSAGGTDKHILPARPSRRLPDITLPDMMTFVFLALQMGHALKDTLYDCWLTLRQLHNPFYGETMK